MSICREWTLVKTSGPSRWAKPLLCRSWNCEFCAPLRKRGLMGRAKAGAPTRFLTLTANPAYGSDPESRRASLAKAFNVIVKRLRRRFPSQQVEYLAVTEATKHGEPHLHVLLRCPYVPQSLISSWMGELMESPIVDIRRIKGMKQVIAYVAKYLVKAPEQFGAAKRYFSSRHWIAVPGDEFDPPTPSDVPWRVLMRPLRQILQEWLFEGYTARQEPPDLLIGVPINPAMLR